RYYSAFFLDLKEDSARSTRADARNRSDNGRKHGQASAEPAAGIQDLQGWPQPERQGKKPGTGRVNHDQ
ncbi:hypothetical protein P9375_08880, partial [Bacillus subtilis]|nr:hypothetical protein [Bacillus subtilis]